MNLKHHEMVKMLLHGGISAKAVKSQILCMVPSFHTSQHSYVKGFAEHILGKEPSAKYDMYYMSYT